MDQPLYRPACTVIGTHPDGHAPTVFRIIGPLDIGIGKEQDAGGHITGRVSQEACLTGPLVEGFVIKKAVPMLQVCPSSSLYITRECMPFSVLKSGCSTDVYPGMTSLPERVRMPMPGPGTKVSSYPMMEDPISRGFDQVRPPLRLEIRKWVRCSPLSFRLVRQYISQIFPDVGSARATGFMIASMPRPLTSICIGNQLCPPSRLLFKTMSVGLASPMPSFLASANTRISPRGVVTMAGMRKV